MTGRNLFATTNARVVGAFCVAALLHLAGTILIPGYSAPFAIRAENISVLGASVAGWGDDVFAAGAVVAVQFHGAASRWQVQLDAGGLWSALVSEEGSRQLAELGVGSRVQLTWPRAAAVPLQG